MTRTFETLILLCACLGLLVSCPDEPIIDDDTTGPCTDSDGDGVCDTDDPCPLDFNDDSDGDGICDSDDVCPGYDDSIDNDGDGVADGCDDCVGGIRAALLPGWGDPQLAHADLLWSHLLVNWSTFGTCPLDLIEFSEPVDLGALVTANINTLIIGDPGGGLTLYSATTNQTIADFLALGYGGAYFSHALWWGSYDNSSLATFAGVAAADVAQGEASCGTTVDILDPTHPLSVNLTAPYTLVTYPWAQGLVTTGYSQSLLPGAQIVHANADDILVVIAYEGATHRGVWATGYPEYRVDAGREAEQLIYNALQWTAGP